MTRTTIFIELGVWAHNRSLFTGEITMMSAASAIGGTKQAITQTVGVLVERGYVERTPDPADAGAKVVTLTERGREAAKASLEIADEVDRAMGDGSGCRGDGGFSFSIDRPGRSRTARRRGVGFAVVPGSQ